MPRGKYRPSTRKDGNTTGRKAYVELTLTIRHTINGQAFGPGHVRVREDIARVLAEQERNVSEAETQLYKPTSKIIGAGNRIIPVRPDHFDLAMERLDPSLYHGR